MNSLHSYLTPAISIFLAISGGLTGIYINNIFTWQIKDKVDALDLMYKIVLKIKDAANDKSTIFKNYLSLMNELELQNSILDKRFTSYILILKPESEIKASNTPEQYDGIVDKILFESRFENIYNELVIQISSVRKEITKARYMLKKALFIR